MILTSFVALATRSNRWVSSRPVWTSRGFEGYDKRVDELERVGKPLDHPVHEAMASYRIASCCLAPCVVRPGAPFVASESSVRSDARNAPFVASSLLCLVFWRCVHHGVVEWLVECLDSRLGKMQHPYSPRHRVSSMMREVF